MKVIREKEKRGPLKGIVFLNNDVSTRKRHQIEDLATKTYDNWNKTNRLTKDDLINLKNNAEISTAKVAGNVIKFYDFELDIENLLNDDETEWNMCFTLKSKKHIIFKSGDFIETLNYKYKGKTIMELITNCGKVDLYTVFT